MGIVLDIVAGAPPHVTTWPPTAGAPASSTAATGDVDFMADPGPGFTA